MLSRKWNDGRHWRRFAALFSCSFLIICFLIHKAKGESSMLLKPEIKQNGTSIEGVLRGCYMIASGGETP